MLSVKLANEQMYAKSGAMIAYTGQVEFSPAMLAGGNIQSMAMRAVTGEGLHLMSAQGQGEVFYAEHGLQVTIINLKGETMYVEADSVLAFDMRLQPGTQFQGNQGVQGLVRGAATGQGLFTSTFTGQGELAILSHGNAIPLEVTPSKPVCVDPQAYVGHKGQLTSQFITDTNWKTFLGQGSGETFQLKFTGQGTIYIQASEV